MVRHIEEYALVGDGQTAALVSTEGSVARRSGLGSNRLKAADDGDRRERYHAPECG